MAASLTQNGLHVGFEPRQKLHGHKGLYGAGKATAVDADSALAAQEMFGRRNGHGHLLVLLVTGGDDVLPTRLRNVVKSPSRRAATCFATRSLSA